MPLYEYVCQDCGTRFEILRAMKDADSTIPCKHCLGVNTRRVLSVFYASSEGRTVTSSDTCDSCAGGSCATCGHN